jgi:hypothetical protein
MIVPTALSKTDRIVFLHIPKTAGTSSVQYFTDMFGSSNIGWLGRDFTIDELLEGRNFDNYRVIGGHFAKAHAANLPFPVVYISIVREPVDRVISYYQHILRTPGEPEKFDLTGNLDEDLYGPFGKAIKNQQSMFLDYPAGELGRDGRIGVCQMKDAATLLTFVARTLNIAPPTLSVLNERKGPRLFVGAETRAKIARLTKKDARLFELMKTPLLQRFRLTMGLAA